MLQTLGMRRGVATGAVVALTVVAAIGIPRLGFDSDLLCALPPHAEVSLFRDLGKDFGVTRLALVGVEADDLFTTEALEALRAVSRAARRVPGVVHLQSLTEVLDVETTAEGAIVAPLVREVPRDPVALRALRTKVLSREGIAGNLVSRSGDAALILAALAPDRDPAEVARSLRRELAPLAGPLRLHFAGAPFVASFMEREVARRLPWAAPLAVGLALALLALSGGRVGNPGRSRWARLWLPVASGGLGGLWTLGGLALANVEPCVGLSLTLLTPVLVGLALGSAAASGASFAAVSAAGIAATAALAALAVVPELRPLSLLSAPGAAAASVAALALHAIRGPAASPPSPVPPPRRAAFRWLVGSCALLVVAAGWGLSRLEADRSGVELFASDDEPRRGDEFLRRRLGVGEVVFVRVQANLRDPRAVRYLERLEEDLRAIPGVVGVQSVTIPLRILHKTLTGRRQIPRSADRLAQLWGMLEGNADVALLVDRARTEAMLHVRIQPDAAAAFEAAQRVQQAMQRLSTIEVLEIRASEATSFSARLAAELARRLSALVVRHGGPRPEGLRDRTEKALRALAKETWVGVARRAVDEYFRSDEALLALRTAEEPEAIAADRAGRLASELARRVFSDARDAEDLLRREAPPSELAGDRGLAAKAAAMLFERVRGAVEDAVVARLREELGPHLRVPARGPSFWRELDTVLASALDRSIVAVRSPVPVRGGTAGLAIRIAATGPALVLEAATGALGRAIVWGAVSACVAVIAVALAAWRALRALVAFVPAALGAAVAFGALGLSGFALDPGSAAVLPLVLGVAAAVGTFAPVSGPSRALDLAAPAWAAAALLGGLAFSGFAPLVRFGTMSALAFLAVSAGAALLAASRAVFRREA